MYTAYIGKRLIQVVNRVQNATYSPRSFFKEVFYPLFFGNERFLMYVINSPVAQAYGQKKKTPLTPAVLQGCLEEIHRKVATVVPEASFFLGGPAAEKTATTSGLITNIQRTIPEEDVYASWIGFALGVGVEGGLSLLLDTDEVLLALMEGWYEYRRLLDQTPNLKSMQVSTWNGQWLTWKLGKDGQAGRSLVWEFNREGTALVTQSWASLLFSLAYQYRKDSRRTINAYVYAFGQQNRTMGFIRLYLAQVNGLADLYSELFTVPEGMHPRAFEHLYNTEASFVKACEFPEIGLRALKPEDSFKMSKGGKAPQDDKLKPEQRLSLQTYQTWIIAMLNNKDLLTLAQDLAQALYRVKTASSRDSRRGKTTQQSLIEEEVLKAQSQRAFIDALTRVLETDSSEVELFNAIVNEIAIMPVGNVPLFLTLLRFKYAAVNNANSTQQGALPI